MGLIGKIFELVRTNPKKQDYSLNIFNEITRNLNI